jgi:hypothetical protein
MWMIEHVDVDTLCLNDELQLVVPAVEEVKQKVICGCGLSQMASTCLLFVACR